MNQEAGLQRNQQQVRAIHEHLLTIRRNMEGLISENRQLRDGLRQAVAKVEQLQQQRATLETQVKEHEQRCVQVGQCVDDALDRVEWALEQVGNEDDEELES